MSEKEQPYDSDQHAGNDTSAETEGVYVMASNASDYSDVVISTHTPIPDGGSGGTETLPTVIERQAMTTGTRADGEEARAQAGVTSLRGQRSGLGKVWEIAKVFLLPVMILASFVGGIALLGVAQRQGWIQSTDSMGGGLDRPSQVGLTSEESRGETTYICPMMCVPPTTKPGRCPVCAMELVPAAAGASTGPSTRIQIDPRARRVAGIETVSAKSEILFREIRGVGEITYDESNLKTLSAYIDGRIEELYADYTGIHVEQDSTLALLYSPDLYSAQVEYLKALEFATTSAAANERVASANARMRISARQRLIELGFTESQVQQIEQTKSARRRFDLKAPISGTVIEKLAFTGQYVKAGEPIYRLADLSRVWLVLEVFPEDASVIRVGQEVMATTQSTSAKSFVGTVEFVDPTVDPSVRTVGIRVVIDNASGELRPGEFARATMKVPHLTKDDQPQQVIVVPRNSLLSVGQTSLAYVERKPGEFELRRVKTGPTAAGMTAVLEGIAEGEQVVARSTFLLDAQMQLQGNPSLMDPSKAVMSDAKMAELTAAEQDEIRRALEPLSAEERALAEQQVICPVTEVRLGSMGMGTPLRVDVSGAPVMICCEGCREPLQREPDRYLAVLREFQENQSRETSQLASPKPKPGDLPKMDLPKMDLPKMDLPKMDLPKMDLPKMELPKMELPKMELPKMELPKMELPKMELPKMDPPGEAPEGLEVDR